MSIEILGPGALDYLPCRYGTSKLLFRGPQRRLDSPYIAFIGGTETYGKFIADPFPALIESMLDLTCVNFGLLNAGVDAFVHDPFVIQAAEGADVTVIQAVGAQNLSNRFYSVHPRRNDRFLAASTLLRTIYNDVDFADFNFNKHLLSHLQTVSPERFQTVRNEVQQAWLARMRLMLGQISGKTVLLWLSARKPEARVSPAQEMPHVLGEDPLFITRDMIDQVKPLVTEVVEVTLGTDVIGADTDGMVFSELEEMAARQMLGPRAHVAAAEALAPVISRLMRRT
jgi:hypothetical protein